MSLKTILCYRFLVVMKVITYKLFLVFFEPACLSFDERCDTEIKPNATIMDVGNMKFSVQCLNPKQI